MKFAVDAGVETVVTTDDGRDVAVLAGEGRGRRSRTVETDIATNGVVPQSLTAVVV